MFRLIILTSSLLFLPAIVQALGMSDMKVLSGFGEEFVAEIELYGVDPNDPDIKDFYNAFIEPVPDSLSNIHEYIKGITISFRKTDGKVKLLLSHPEYYLEPYIEFSLFLSSGNINVTRTFTALIDFPQTRIAAQPVQPAVPVQPIPEKYSEPVIATPIQWQGTTGTRIIRPGESLYTISREIQRQLGGDIHQIMETVFSTNQHAFINNDRNLIMAGAQVTIPDVSEIQPVSEQEEVVDIDQLEEYGPVLAGDTLFRISRRYQQYYDDSIPALADKIFNLNPHAFIRNDINLLRQGVMLKLPPQGQVAMEERLEAVTTDAPLIEEVSEDHLEILVPTDDESRVDTTGDTVVEGVKQKLEDTLVDLEDVVRENSELKNSVEVSKKQINILQQHLDESNIKIEQLQAQIDELKNQAGSSTIPVSTDQPAPDAMASTRMENLVERYNEYPWTVLLIIIVVGIAVIVLIVLINNMRSVEEIEPEQKDFEFRERVPDNELKARIKQKLSKREYETGKKTGGNPFEER